jgi:hypothetical protein
MSKRIVNALSLCALIIISINFASCSKSSPVVPSTDICAGKTIVITPTIKASATCSPDGSIEVTATGSTGFTYKLNSTGIYQASVKFTDLAAGNYTVFAKDGAGCEKSATATVASSGTAGPLFAAVKALMVSKCQKSCHDNTVANGGMNWQVECNIIANKARIKDRAVDLGTMPPTGPLSQAEKNTITDWITAGGGFGN